MAQMNTEVARHVVPADEAGWEALAALFDGAYVDGGVIVPCRIGGSLQGRPGDVVVADALGRPLDVLGVEQADVLYPET